jgi:hypothetical protein
MENTERDNPTAFRSSPKSVAMGVNGELRDPRAELVDQILASRTFAKSMRLSQFLEFVCRKALEGRTSEINEQQIGIHVFGRSSSYNPGDDSIVRTQARLLRQKLEEYFESESPDSATVVVIPKGGYVPTFLQRPNPASGVQVESPVRSSSPSIGGSAAATNNASRPVDLAGALSPLPASEIVLERRPEPQPERRPEPLASQGGPTQGGGWKTRIVRSVGWIVVAACLMGAGVLIGRLQRATQASTASSSLWNAIFLSDRPTVIVPSDDGLVLAEEYRHASVNLDEYLRESYVLPSGTAEQPSGKNPAAAPMTGEWLSSHQYTSTADLNVAIRLTRLPEATVSNTETRYARALRLDDLKNSNVILIGGIGANPWVGLFSNRLNFDVNYDWKSAQGYVLNKQPHAGEQSRYLESYGNGITTSYGVLALLPGISGQGNALLFEGSGMAGTEAATDFPFNQEEFANFLKQLGKDPQGRIPYFEVLLETRSVGGNAPQAQVLAWRKLQP